MISDKKCFNNLIVNIAANIQITQIIFKPEIKLFKINIRFQAIISTASHP